MTRTGSQKTRVFFEPPVMYGARFCSAGDSTVSMFSNGTSRLSATIMVVEVMTPWPMSIRGNSKYTRLSGLISIFRSNVFGVSVT